MIIKNLVKKTKGLSKSLVSVIILGLTGSFSISAEKSHTFTNEKLDYTISYKWGLIHKDAAKATLSLHQTPSAYDITLTARTQPWADKFFEVRDTLKAEVSKEGFKPKTYTKIAHEGGRYDKDLIRYSYAGSVVKGKVERNTTRKDGSKSASSKIITASGATFDMLSVFYYIRSLDFSALKPGDTKKVSIFSGSKVELLTICYKGTETIKLKDKSKAEAYHLTFTFTSGGKKKSSDDMNAWISTDPRHIPLYLTGKLPVGEVRVYYNK